MEWSGLNPWIVNLFKNRLNFYLCHPDGSYEKRSFANMNRLLRRYLSSENKIPWSNGNKVMNLQIEDIMKCKLGKILDHRTPDDIEMNWGPRRRRRIGKETMAVISVVVTC